MRKVQRGERKITHAMRSDSNGALRPDCRVTTPYQLQLARTTEAIYTCIFRQESLGRAREDVCLDDVKVKDETLLIKWIEAEGGCAEAGCLEALRLASSPASLVARPLASRAAGWLAERLDS